MTLMVFSWDHFFPRVFPSLPSMWSKDCLKIKYENKSAIGQHDFISFMILPGSIEHDKWRPNNEETPASKLSNRKPVFHQKRKVGPWNNKICSVIISWASSFYGPWLCTWQGRGCLLTPWRGKPIREEIRGRRRSNGKGCSWLALAGCFHQMSAWWRCWSLTRRNT